MVARLSRHLSVLAAGTVLLAVPSPTRAQAPAAGPPKAAGQTPKVIKAEEQKTSEEALRTRMNGLTGKQRDIKRRIIIKERRLELKNAEVGKELKAIQERMAELRAEIEKLARRRTEVMRKADPELVGMYDEVKTIRAQLLEHRAKLAEMRRNKAKKKLGILPKGAPAPKPPAQRVNSALTPAAPKKKK